MNALAPASVSVPARGRVLSGRRGWLLVLAVIIAMFVLVGLAGELTPAPQGPAGSSYATSAHGAAAWAELLSENGYSVSRLRAPLAHARVATPDTLIVVGAGSFDADTGAQLRRFVAGGGRLVLVGPGRAASRAVVAAGPSGQVGGPIIVQRLGAGRVETLVSAASVENSGLGQGDDALLALRVTGPRGRPVVFAEALHGYTTATGLAAFPARWWVTIGGLVLAAGLWALARGRRLGPVEPTAPAPVPPRAAYVEAMARALVARTVDGPTMSPARFARGLRRRRRRTSGIADG